MNEYITIDGVDCTGKSTISKLLARHINGRVIKCATDKELIKIINNTKDINCKYLYYLASYLEVILTEINVDYKYPIIDRSLYSNIAYHKSLGATIKMDDILQILPKPNINIYLTCSKEIWLKRMSKKKKLDWYEDRLINDYNLVRKIEAKYQRMGLINIKSESIKLTIDEILQLTIKAGISNE